ncbi:MAG: 2-phospho-L-lactate transferase CofD family protein, partial [Deltaproteobacteria bacterium]|nr:2-phospho-L-lactate transferase CofD family protein [Deltaproteobacteria bacterium]
LDTVVYTLAGREGPLGWGLAGDTHAALGALQRYYAHDWFRLGDADLATHIFRTDALRRGTSLTAVTAAIMRAHGVSSTLLPMSDDPVRTLGSLAGAGTIAFQDYLVRRRGRGRVRAIRYAGARRARPAPGVLAALRGAGAVILPPSNPFVSIGPILAMRGVRDALRARRVPVAAISPLVHGRPIKGPLDRMLRGLGHEVSSVGVARLYRGLADIFVLDRSDAALAARIEALGMRALVIDTIMKTPARSRALAGAVLKALGSRC